MLSIRSSSSPTSSEQCTPNVLPCRIQRAGPVNASERYWAPETAKDGKSTVYFRGRKLAGKHVELPTGYRALAYAKGAHSHSGAVVRKTNYSIQAPKQDAISVPSIDADIDEFNEEEDQREEPVTILEEQASFKEVVVWGHESMPADDDMFLRGIEEWIPWAEAMHSFGKEKEKEK